MMNTVTVKAVVGNYALTTRTYKSDGKPTMAPEAVLTATPNRIPKGTVIVGFTALMGMAVRGDLSKSQAYQMGYAWAEWEHGNWELVSHEVTDKLEVFIMTNGRRTIKAIDTLTQAKVWGNGKSEDVQFRLCSVYEQSGEKWNKLPIAFDVRRHVMEEVAGRAVTTAWTYWHILGRMLAEMPIRYVSGSISKDRTHMLEGYQRQLWQVAGYSRFDMPIPTNRFHVQNGLTQCVQYRRGKPEWMTVVFDGCSVEDLVHAK